MFVHQLFLLWSLYFLRAGKNLALYRKAYCRRMQYFFTTGGGSTKQLLLQPSGVIFAVVLYSRLAQGFHQPSEYVKYLANNVRYVHTQVLTPFGKKRAS